MAGRPGDALLAPAAARTRHRPGKAGAGALLLIIDKQRPASMGRSSTSCCPCGVTWRAPGVLQPRDEGWHDPC
jgi:hypothetical protein